MKIIRLAFVPKNAWYIKGNITKYIAPKLFYGEIETLQTKSNMNEDYKTTRRSN